MLIITSVYHNWVRETDMGVFSGFLWQWQWHFATLPMIHPNQHFSVGSMQSDPFLNDISLNSHPFVCLYFTFLFVLNNLCFSCFFSFSFFFFHSHAACTRVFFVFFFFVLYSYQKMFIYKLYIYHAILLSCWCCSMFNWFNFCSCTQQLHIQQQFHCFLCFA